MRNREYGSFRAALYIEQYAGSGEGIAWLENWLEKIKNCEVES
jgi:hypothetical protein